MSKYKKIVLKKVKVHNLKGVDLTLTPFQLIVFTGVSGSGKSSLAFDTLYVEGQRRYIESLSTYARRQLGELPKPEAELIEGISPSIAIEQKSSGKNPRSTVGTLTGIYDFMRVLYARIGIAHCPISGQRVTPQSAAAIVHKVKQFPKGTKVILFCSYAKGKKGEFKEDFAELVRKGFMRVRLDGSLIDLGDEVNIAGNVAHTIDLVIDRLTVDEDNLPRLKEGISRALDLGAGVMSVLNIETGEEELFSEHAYSEKSGLSYPPLEPQDFSFNHPHGMCPSCQGLGAIQNLEVMCPTCLGARIKPYPAATLLGGKTIFALTRLPVQEALIFFQSLPLNPSDQLIGEELLKEITQRLTFLIDVGLHYLTLDRTSPTLSGGEAQRVRLSAQIGSGLVGTTYVLDEPSIGLHPRDNTKLIETLKKLRDKGNTVIVVEHDEETIAAADEIVDVGPLAGKQGGEIVAQGDLKTIMESPRSLTGGYLSGRLRIPIPKKRRHPKHFLTLEKASHHNLKHLTVDFPLGVFIGVTGVSGSGKSSLITDTLFPQLSNLLNGSTLISGRCEALKGFEALDKVISIDQSPIGRTPRSNPATYVKVFDEIRDLFALVPEAVARGFKSGHFSFNVKEGSCPHCSGMGMTKIDMDFMEDEWTPCTFCLGKRFDEKTLSIKYRNKTIHDILEMTVAEAAEFFEPLPSIRKRLETLITVGLDYIQLGQPSPSLSGGEAQRIKLAKELARPATGKTFYILDEPTTGLHFHDIQKLIHILQKLVDRGNSVLVIEHNFDLIKTVDWIIDIGPEGGAEGGKLIAEGKPEKIAKLSTPTGIALHKALFPVPLTPSPGKHGQVHEEQMVTVMGACQNNLKNVHIAFPRNKITVCTGPSGSGKSSFAFETVYAEGQRRYTEALTAYAKQFIKQLPKPKVDQIEGLSPSIAIEQKNHAGNPRSTLGTMTETYDYLRLVYAHQGIAYDPETFEKIETITTDKVLSRLLSLPENTPLYILTPITIRKHETFSEVKERLQKEGFLRLRLDKTYYELGDDIPFDPKRKHALFLLLDRMKVNQGIRQRLFEAITLATNLSGSTVTIDTGQEDLFFNLNFAVAKTGKSFPPITPHTFSFNTEEGMCLTCLGLGIQYGADLSHHPALSKMSLIALIQLLWKDNATDLPLSFFLTFLHSMGVKSKTRLENLGEKERQLLFSGSPELFAYRGFTFRWMGINHALLKMAKSDSPTLKEYLLTLLNQKQCPSCQGSRLNPLARHVQLEGVTLPELCHRDVHDAYTFLSNIPIHHPFLEEPMRGLLSRLQFLISIGLGYLSLDRSAPTLSGGETQRVRLARQLGTGLTGALYILDEPTIGLHPHDNEKLNHALRDLCDLGNTLLLVEHDPLTIETADYLIDFGPKAGKEGGTITAHGTLEQIKANPHSLTGAYLSGKKEIPLPPARRSFTETITLKNVSLHNLKGFDVHFPVEAFTCVSGVSGSGKSTLMHDLLKPHIQSHLSLFESLLVLDQNPIGGTVRSDVSTYVDLLTPIRYLFAELKEAKARGLLPRHFSTNHRKGMCTACRGLGFRSVSLQFLPSVRVTCDQCKGYRLNPLSLQVTYQGKNLGQILRMTVNEAKQFLPHQPKIHRILDTLIAVGLDYLTLGQEMATLSGGEAQRIRLSRELSKRTRGRTYYLLDEPTVGLHSEDIAKLLPIFHKLVDKGHTVIIIEHNLDVIANSDYVIDLGPGPGKLGGYLLAAGTPEEVAQNAQSITGKYLFLKACEKK